jgi:hypothetical protein
VSWGVAFEFVCELAARAIRSLVVGALFRVGRSWAERVVGVGDLVFDSVAGDRACGAVPAFGVPAALRSFAEGLAGPCRLGRELAFGELVA